VSKTKPRIYIIGPFRAKTELERRYNISDEDGDRQ
jgi:hypothetical protein